MEKFVEVVAKSNFGTMVIIRSKTEEYENIDMAVSYTMYRVRELNTKDEKFTIESVRAMTGYEYKGKDVYGRDRI